MAYFNGKRIFFSPKIFIDGDTDAAFEAGKKAEYDKFWDKYQNGGKRTFYNYAFRGYGWGNDTFYPKYDLICKGDAGNMFYAWDDYNTEPFDLKARLQECGVILDVSGATRINYMFAVTNFTKIPAVDFTGASAAAETYQQNAFYNSKVLNTIENLTINENNLFKNWFYQCYALEELRISGTIGKNNFDVHYSKKLSKASLLSILNACNKQVTGISVTLPLYCIDGKTDTELLLSETGDVDLYNASMAARSYGYTFTFA